MPIRDSKDLFLTMLSDVRHGAEQSTKLFNDLAELAQDADVKEALKARVSISDKIVGSLDECFRLLGEKPRPAGKLHEMYVEDFRKGLAEIQDPEAKRLYILAKAIRLLHFRMGEYVALIAAADITEHYGVGVLLETCLADKIAMAEQARRLIRERIRERIAA
jgi:ferritin-like metal-binding protein YciE